MTLPKDDQPDNYQGSHHRTHVRWLALDPWNLIAHLWIPNDKRAGNFHVGTYCTGGNYRDLVDLKGFKLHGDMAGYIVGSNTGFTVGALNTRGHALSLNGDPLELCPACMTMALTQAEMQGQNKYPIKGLIAAMDKQPANTIVERENK